jgi:hypothetical protein
MFGAKFSFLYVVLTVVVSAVWKQTVDVCLSLADSGV